MYRWRTELDWAAPAACCVVLVLVLAVIYMGQRSSGWAGSQTEQDQGLQIPDEDVVGPYWPVSLFVFLLKFPRNVRYGLVVGTAWCVRTVLPHCTMEGCIVFKWYRCELLTVCVWWVWCTACGSLHQCVAVAGMEKTAAFTLGQILLIPFVIFLIRGCILLI